MTSDIPEFPEDKMNILEGKYEVFQVGNEWVFSDDREKIKKYAKEQDVERINYKASFDSKKGAEEVAEEIK